LTLHQEVFRLTISYEGNGITGFWTKRALSREGFKMVEDPTAINRLILNENSPRWTFNEGEQRTEFNNIYQLVRFIRRF